MAEPIFLEELHQRYYPGLVSYFHRRLAPGSREDAEDMAGEIVFRAWHKYEELQTQEAVNRWVYRIARNLLIDKKRRENRWQAESSLDAKNRDGESLLDNLPDLVGLGPQKVLLDRHLAWEVHRAVEKLPESHRQVITMHHFLNMEVLDIARVLNIPNGTVKSRLSRARTLMKRHLERKLCLETTP